MNSVKKLDLRAPLRFYREAYPAEGEESMRIYLLDRSKGSDFDPPTDTYLEEPILSAAAAGDGEETPIPQGSYLFAQAKAVPDKALITDLAVEVQKEGLWQGLAMENRVYVRVLWEDDGMVTQVLRPLVG